MSDACHHRIDIEPVGIGDRGRRYRVHHAGAVLIERSRNPEFDACRALLAKGFTGRLEMWHRGASFAALRLDIEKGAKFTVEERDAKGLQIVRWRPSSEDGDQNAPAYVPNSSRTGAEDCLGVDRTQSDRLKSAAPCNKVVARRPGSNNG